MDIVAKISQAVDAKAVQTSKQGKKRNEDSLFNLKTSKIAVAKADQPKEEFRNKGDIIYIQRGAVGLSEVS